METVLDNAVSQIFDEFQAALSVKTKLHPSEEVAKVVFVSDISALSIDVINCYHMYCKLCEQHFYSRSEAQDINSFFQKHINTGYHWLCKNQNLLSPDTPMITWQEKWFTGHCNVCEMSDLNSYIIDTDLSLLDLKMSHECFWKMHYPQSNDNFLRKLCLLKTYCGLSFFYDKVIRTLKGNTICLLCRVKLSGLKEKDKHHLKTDDHYRNFIVFIWNTFGLSPKDLLNGFHLEQVTRWMLLNELPLCEATDCNERERCFEISNNDSPLYPTAQHNFSYCPKNLPNLREFQGSDVIANNICLMCNKVADEVHLNLDSHRRLERYKNFFWKVSTSDKEVREPVKPPGEGSPNSSDYFEKLWTVKLSLIKQVFSKVGKSNSFCEVCEIVVPANQQEAHVTTAEHEIQTAIWEKLVEISKNTMFMEPFQRVKEMIVCLLCGALLTELSFFSHVKGQLHFRKVGWYLSAGFSSGITSIIRVRPNFTSYCLICNLEINKKMSPNALKTSLKKRIHWTCAGLNIIEEDQQQKKIKNKETGSSPPEEETKENVLDVREKRERLEKVSESGSTERDPPSDDAKEKSNAEGRLPETPGEDSPDFGKIQRTLQDILKLFEMRMIKDVTDRSIYLIGRLGKSDGVSQKPPKPRAGSRPKAMTEPKQEENPTKNGENGEVDKEDREGEPNGNKERTGELKEDKVKETSDDEDEVLIVKGLPKGKLKYEGIYVKFSRFGKIRYVFFEEGNAYVAFTKKGVAKAIVDGPRQFVAGSACELEFATRRRRKKVTQTDVLDIEIRRLLSQPPQLTGFILSLVEQSIATCSSRVELKREELVCRTIISAVSKAFPLSRCYPFGSRLSGLTLTNSDLDVFLDCGDTYDGIMSKTGRCERRLVNEIAKMLRKKWEIVKINVVDRARVPIISFLHRPSALHCDLSFKNGLSVQNTSLIRFMVSLDARVRALILFLKYWANLNSIHGPPYFSSYAIAMMVIYFLQRLPEPLLPTIEDLQKAFQGRRITIAGWDCSFVSDVNAIPRTRNVDHIPQLLAEFFSFYANFNYAKYAISPLSGKPLPRDALLGKAQLPMCYKRHVINIPLDNWGSNKLALCIVDPFDLSHILTKSFTRNGLEVFVRMCKDSHALLNRALDPSKAVIMEGDEGVGRSLEKSEEPQERKGDA